MPRDFDLTRYLPYLLNRSGTRIADSFSVMLRNSYGVTLQMWRVMAAVHHRDAQRVGELSDPPPDLSIICSCFRKCA